MFSDWFNYEFWLKFSLFDYWEGFHFFLLETMSDSLDNIGANKLTGSWFFIMNQSSNADR